MTDNLTLWKAVEKTPPAHTKAITGKSYSGTSPKPHYLVLKATETFGPCGIGWGFNIVDERIEEGAGGERLSIARVKVWYEWNGRRGEVEHIGGTQFSGVRSSGKAFTDEDAPKKSVTDALVKALSMIGFAGDIFMGRYDDSKYVAELREEARQEPAGNAASRGAGGGSSPTAPASPNREDPADTYVKAALVAMSTAKTADDLKAWWAGEANARDDFGITKGGKRYAVLWDAFLLKGTALKSQPDPDAWQNEEAA